ncbi:MAG: VacJ family lipoprotein [Alphaproteobacteria bacterium]|nr:VacJ family lipoprotein [Alphaproteobacteria bacterium]
MLRRQPQHVLSGLVYAAALALSGAFASGASAQQPTPVAPPPRVVAPAPVVAPSPVDTGDAGDPWESTNRAIFGFNQQVDRAVLVPVANAYRTVLPSPVRDMIHDFLQNLNSPIIFANDVLQVQPGLAAETAGRAMINTTIGFGGLFDVAAKMGIPFHTNDLGITLATYGVDSGPYLMLPVLGPSNPRDLFGDVADSFGDPGNIVASDYHKLYASFARGLTSGIDERSRNIESLAEIERTSLDYYATIRSLARQRRAAQIRHQKEDVPNAAPLQGASALPAPVPAKNVAELPANGPAISYRMMSPQPAINSLADLQKSSMAPAAAPQR